MSAMSVTGVLLVGDMTSLFGIRVWKGCRRGDGGTSAPCGMATELIGAFAPPLLQVYIGATEERQRERGRNGRDRQSVRADPPHGQR